MQEPVNDILKSSLENIKDIIDSSYMIGSPIGSIVDSLVIPISSVKFGFAAGGLELFKDKLNNPYGGLTGGNINISPVGFLVIKDGNISLLHLESKTHILEKLIDNGESIIDKLMNKNEVKM